MTSGAVDCAIADRGDREIRKTIDQLEDEDLKGMRSDKEEELLECAPLIPHGARMPVVVF